MASKRLVWLSVMMRGLIAIVLLGAAIGVFSLLKSAREEPQRTGEKELSPRVTVIHAQPIDVRRQWEAFGTTRAIDAADVPARVSSVVETIPADVEEGLPVAMGQLLVELDDSDFVREAEIARQNINRLTAEIEQAQIERESWRRRVEIAEEQTEIAKADLERVKQALADGAARQREVDQGRAGVLTAIQNETSARETLARIDPRIASLEAQMAAEESRLDLAQLNVERSRVRSPIAGVLQAVDVEMGENVNRGQRLARVVSLERIEVPLRIAASVRPHLELGEEARILGTGTDDRVWSSRITRIAPESDPDTRTTTIYTEVSQPAETKGAASGALAPGQFVRALVMSTSSEQRWVVPRRSVDEGSILIVNDAHVRRRQVKIDYQVEMRLRDQFGIEDSLWVVLEEPLEPGLPVIVNPTPALIDGLKVEPVSADEPDDAHVGATPDRAVADREGSP